MPSETAGSPAAGVAAGSPTPQTRQRALTSATFGRIVESFGYKIMDFCDWSDCAALTSVNRVSARATVHSPYHYRWLCETLKRRNLLHIPDSLPSTSHRDLFFEMWGYRQIFLPRSHSGPTAVLRQSDLQGLSLIHI